MDNEETVGIDKYKELEERYNELVGFKDEFLPIGEKLADNPELLRAIADGKLDDQALKNFASGESTVAEAVKETEKRSEGPTDVVEAMREEFNKRVSEIEKRVDERFNTQADVEKLINDHNLSDDDLDAIADWYKKNPDSESRPVSEVYEQLLGRKAIEQARAVRAEAEAARLKAEAEGLQGGEGSSTATSDKYNPFGKTVKKVGF